MHLTPGSTAGRDRLRHALRAVSVLGAGAVLLAGCAAEPVADDGVVRIVASTDVYGDIAAQIAGDYAEVTAIVTGQATDPHAFEANARVQLAMTRADVVVANGGGYDDFVGTMLGGSSQTVVLNAVDLSGRDVSAPRFNEHVWYDLPTMRALGEELAAVLADADPDRAADYRANAVSFSSAIERLEERVSALADQYGGTGVAVTEPVPLYLLEAMGLVNRTPAAFSDALENGSDVAPGVLLDTIAELTGGEVRVLVYNAQTSGPATDQLRAAAQRAGIPAVAVTETLPDGVGYLDWMNATISAIEEALREK